ncbi:MAG: carbon storage regulator [Deltaproteobacteria bacterium]|nr:MAG: carbon storage regulator [Deltaproteobacteria bacterium]
MLVLTRKVGEKLRIGNDVVVSVLDVGRGTVKIGIKAPRQTAIYRDEVYERIRQENIEAARNSAESVNLFLELWREKKGS